MGPAIEGGQTVCHQIQWNPVKSLFKSGSNPRKTPVQTLRAKGALISEPQCSIPCDMRFYFTIKGKWPLLRVFPWKWPFSLYRVGKSHVAGVENRGSLISVPSALREVPYRACPDRASTVQSKSGFWEACSTTNRPVRETCGFEIGLVWDEFWLDINNNSKEEILRSMNQSVQVSLSRVQITIAGDALLEGRRTHATFTPSPPSTHSSRSVHSLLPCLHSSTHSSPSLIPPHSFPLLSPSTVWQQNYD